MPKFKEYIANTKRFMKYVAPPIKHNKGRIALSTVLSLTTIGFNYLFAYMLTQLYKGLNSNEDPEFDNIQIDAVTYSALIGISWYLSNNLVAATKEWIIAPASSSAGNELAKTYIDTVMQSPYQIFQEADQSDLYTNYYRVRFSSPPAISLTFTDLIPTLANMVVTAGMTIPYGWAGGLLPPVTLAYLSFSVGTTNPVMSRRETAIKTHNDAFANIEKNFKYRSVMDSFNKTKSELSVLADLMAISLKTDVNASVYTIKMGILQSIISAIGYTGLMAYYTNQVVNGQMDVNGFILVSTYLSGYFLSLNTLGNKSNALLTGVTDINFVVKELKKFEEVIDHYPATHLECTQDNCNITFKNVMFSYKPNTPVIDDLSLTIKPGQKVCVVGPSGSGKSTLSYLLFRLYELNNGEIYINDTNIANISLKSLRDTIGLVPQTTVLLPGTLRENFLYGCEGRDINDKELHDVLNNVGLSELIPKLDDKEFGDLSGGQKQRVAIARVLLKNPNIIITDEATSALDAESERRVQQTMDRTFKGKITFNITHRLDTAVNADMIFVLVKGKVVEHGTHHKLLQKNGEYASLWYKQKLESQTDQNMSHRLFSKSETTSANKKTTKKKINKSHYVISNNEHEVKDPDKKNTSRNKNH